MFPCRLAAVMGENGNLGHVFLDPCPLIFRGKICILSYNAAKDQGSGVFLFLQRRD